ncbi:hypothetical protein TBLA_0C05720 [Henningerozyma blattae CBS 6284]|uniref:glucan endo-1,3-beta-D-glucosidase n=1 Tax=Henningerozyma blattae (strain ATCC 34711 / CBS 6284 / DSM 70876 / NBRC 10599 / NRRL Y-10934 / UCD 77-7) TaxID=1071380 RepID=I2H1W8_HENB6|nr:hypothetical protein TBLA_0C05720 [Tetrapisispora blattae CBS 6284]CCH60370.1 hypothetical protein TBLA_0C05720 [Tetrapisispora blattae CBS 6284]
MVSITSNLITLAAILAYIETAIAVKAYDKISFTNVGFAGTYFPVKKLEHITDEKKCTCEVAEAKWFSGINAPLSEYLSVHFRGPLTLNKFAFYSSPSFVINNNRTSSDWTRGAYYDADSKSTENVTFLTKAGENSPCLGKALAYAGSDGLTKASEATVLAKNALISSGKEYTIYSNVSCPSSGVSNGCGVYRKGIPAFYGFGGITKMFLFEFEMPTETEKNSTSIEYFDMPAIWLLNDHIARTSQYPTNANCSCWASGCGEFDIFEVMNGTERNNLYSTFHTFQGIEDLGTGIQSYGYIPRDTNGVMRGGVIFDSNGDTITFLSNDTTFDSTYSAGDVSKLLSDISKEDTYSSQLMTISRTAPSTTSKNLAVSFKFLPSGIWYYLFSCATALVQAIFI